MTVAELSKLIDQRGEALDLWRVVKRLAGPCLDSGHPLTGRVGIDRIVMTTPLERAGSNCVVTVSPLNWCPNCRIAYRYWRTYIAIAYQVQRELNE